MGNVIVRVLTIILCFIPPLFCIWGNINIPTVWQLQGAILNVIGSLIAITGYIGSKYEEFYNNSMGRWSYNKPGFISVSQQTFSALVGFTVVALGFVEQTISNIPYQTSFTPLQVSIIILIINFIIVNFAVLYKTWMSGFQLGLLHLNWVYKSNSDITNDYVRTFMNSKNLNVGNRTDTIQIEKMANKNLRLLLNLAKMVNKSK